MTWAKLKEVRRTIRSHLLGLGHDLVNRSDMGISIAVPHSHLIPDVVLPWWRRIIERELRQTVVGRLLVIRWASFTQKIRAGGTKPAPTDWLDADGAKSRAPDWLGLKRSCRRRPSTRDEDDYAVCEFTFVVERVDPHAPRRRHRRLAL